MHIRNSHFSLLLLLVVATSFSASDTAHAGGSHAQVVHAPAWLGVVLHKEKDVPGVKVKRTIRQSPADKSGLKMGDILLHVDGKSVDSARDVQSQVGKRHPKDIIKIQFKRGKHILSAAVKLGIFPTSEEMLRMDKLGTFAPSWKGLQSIQGVVPKDVSAARGKVVVIDFWASWCSACRYTTPDINRWHKTLRAQGVVVIGVTSDPPKIAVKATQAHKIHYPVLSDTQHMFRDYGINSLPSLFIIDKKGVIREIVVGYTASEYVRAEALIHKLVAEK
jgi:peroxiredoxin